VRTMEAIGNWIAKTSVETRKALMQVEEYETIVEVEEELLSMDLFGINYARLCPELQEWVRGRVITCLWNEYAAHGPVGAA